MPARGWFQDCEVSAIVGERKACEWIGANTYVSSTPAFSISLLLVFFTGMAITNADNILVVQLFLERHRLALALASLLLIFRVRNLFGPSEDISFHLLYECAIFEHCMRVVATQQL